MRVSLFFYIPKEKLTPTEKHGLFFIIIMLVMTIVTGGYWSGFVSSLVIFGCLLPIDKKDEVLKKIEFGNFKKVK